MLLDRKKLLTRDVLEIEKVDLGNGDFVYVSQMMGHDRDVFEQSLIRYKKDSEGKQTWEQALGNFRAKLAVVTICDEKGNLLLKPDDYQIFGKSISAVKLEKIVEVAQRLNKITEEDKEALVKN